MKKKFPIVGIILIAMLFACNKDKEMNDLKTTVSPANTTNKSLGGYHVFVGQHHSVWGLQTNQPLDTWTHYLCIMNISGASECYGPKIFRKNSKNKITEYANYRIVRIDPNLFSGVISLSDNWYPLPSDILPGASTGGALDYMRHPGILAAIAGTPWKSVQNIIINNSIPKFDSLFAGARKIYAFGSNAASTPGLHYITQNQGEIGAYQNYNGVWQDGGVIVQKYELISFRRVWNPVLRRYIYQPVYGNTYYLLMISLPNQISDFSDAQGMCTSYSEFNQESISVAANQSKIFGPFSGTQLTFELLSCTGNPNLHVYKGYPNSNTLIASSTNLYGPEFIRVFGEGQYYLSIEGNIVSSTCNYRVRAAN